MIEGIDVSAYDGGIRDAGVGFAIVKVSEGGSLDASAGPHAAQAIAAGDVLGAYHYLRLAPYAEAQAALFAASTPREALFLCLDVEGPELENASSRPTFLAMARAFIAWLHAHDPRPVLLYSSRGTWPGSLGQDGNWVADYTGDPNRLFLRLTGQGVAWLIWQWSGVTGQFDRDRFAGSSADLRDWCAAHTRGQRSQGGSAVQFIQVSTADAAVLPRLNVPAGTVIEDFEGTAWATIGPTSVPRLPGLVNAHTDRVAVVVMTARFYADHLMRPTVQVAVLKGA